MPQKDNKLIVQGFDINLLQDTDFLSLTDMLKAKDGDFFISDWLRNRNTVEFLGIWETLHNPDFNYGGFATIKSQVGLNSYKLSIKEWIEQTNAIGIKATAGRYGGTYAHQDIAFEFGMWINPAFKLHLIKEYQRLKIEEMQRLESGWDAKRTLASVNYTIHTDAIKEFLKPIKGDFTYPTEADMLNTIVFGDTHAKWKNKNKDITGNQRDYASVEQLVIMANLETINALLMGQGKSRKERAEILHNEAQRLMRSLLDNKSVKKLK